MILLITVAFFFLVLILPPFWAFGLSFFMQAAYFQNGTTDISSFGFLVVLLRLISSRKIDIAKLLNQYNSIKLFVFILAVNIIWSVSWGANAKEFIIGNIRIMIAMLTFAYFLSEKSNPKAWFFLIVTPFLVFTLHNYLLSIELHPLYETLKEYGRLSGRTITGEMLNSNQAAYTLFSLFVIFYIFNSYNQTNNVRFGKLMISLMAFLILLVSGSLGSRTVIFSTFLLLPLLYLDLRVVIGITFISLVFISYIDFASIEVPFIGEAANERIREIGTEEVSTESEMSRAIIYSSGLNILFDNFIFGIGTGQILETMSLNKYLGEPMMLHNAYLDFSIQFGLVGIFISVWIIVIGVKITQSNLNLGFVYFVTILLPNFGHDFFQISLTPILMILMEYYSQKMDTNTNLQQA